MDDDNEEEGTTVEEEEEEAGFDGPPLVNEVSTDDMVTVEIQIHKMGLQNKINYRYICTGENLENIKIRIIYANGNLRR